MLWLGPFGRLMKKLSSKMKNAAIVIYDKRRASVRNCELFEPGDLPDR
jgi:hypothetical protein